MGEEGTEEWLDEEGGAWTERLSMEVVGPGVYVCDGKQAVLWLDEEMKLGFGW